MMSFNLFKGHYWCRNKYYKCGTIFILKFVINFHVFFNTGDKGKMPRGPSKLSMNKYFGEIDIKRLFIFCDWQEIPPVK